MDGVKLGALPQLVPRMKGMVKKVKVGAHP